MPERDQWSARKERVSSDRSLRYDKETHLDAGSRQRDGLIEHQLHEGLAEGNVDDPAVHESLGEHHAEHLERRAFRDELVVVDPVDVDWSREESFGRMDIFRDAIRSGLIRAWDSCIRTCGV